VSIAMQYLTRRAFLVSVAAASGVAARGPDQAFPNWSREFADKLLTDSPWVRQLNVPFRLAKHEEAADKPVHAIRARSPQTTVRGQGARAEAYLTLRWSSALPIRQALAIVEFGRAGLDSPRAVELLNCNEPSHILEIFGFPTTVFSRGAKYLEEELLRTAILEVDQRSSAAPSSVRVPEYGMHLAATLRFPRFADLTANEGVLQFSAAAGPLRIAQKFKLKEMVYEGRLEL
jgi:hypothetical protein